MAFEQKCARRATAAAGGSPSVSQSLARSVPGLLRRGHDRRNRRTALTDLCTPPIESQRCRSLRRRRRSAHGRRARRQQHRRGQRAIGKNRVRIGVQLIEASSQQTLWSERFTIGNSWTYSRYRAGRQVASCAGAAGESVYQHERRRNEKRPTQHLEAYQLYLQSRSASADRKQNLAAIERLRKAIALDPGFAAARAQLAYHLVFALGNFDSPARIDEGIADAEAALRIDPLLPAGHSTLALGYSMKGLDRASRLRTSGRWSSTRMTGSV